MSTFRWSNGYLACHCHDSLRPTNHPYMHALMDYVGNACMYIHIHGIIQIWITITVATECKPNSSNCLNNWSFSVCSIHWCHSCQRVVHDCYYSKNSYCLLLATCLRYACANYAGIILSIKASSIMPA